MKKPIIAVTGPTASGKTDLGKLIAQKYNGAVVSVDSRQVYIGLDLGTGKDKSFRQEMIDVVLPKEKFSVAEYTYQTLPVIRKIQAKNKLPILVGGTGYYLEALLYDKKFPDVDNQKLTDRLEKLTTDELIDELAKLDPISAKRCDKNRRRTVRALEIVKTSGKPVPKIIARPRFNHLQIVLDPGQKVVDQRIENRLRQRIDAGMIEEVRQLNKTVDPSWLKNLGLEYKYITLYLEGKLSKKEMTTKLLAAIRRYSRRQRTWFRRYADAVWIKSSNQAFEVVDLHMNSVKRYNNIKD